MTDKIKCGECEYCEPMELGDGMCEYMHRSCVVLLNEVNTDCPLRDGEFIGNHLQKDVVGEVIEKLERLIEDEATNCLVVKKVLDGGDVPLWRRLELEKTAEKCEAKAEGIRIALNLVKEWRRNESEKSV